MTQLEYLKRELRNIKATMKYCKSSIGMLGNQYYHWNEEKQKVEKQIQDIRDSKISNVWQISEAEQSGVLLMCCYKPFFFTNYK